MQAALNYNSTRIFVWQLLSNVSLGENGQRTCKFPSGYIAAVTHLFGQVLSTDAAQQLVPDGDELQSGTALQIASKASGPDTAAAHPPGDTVHSLSFGYVPNWFQMPPDAQDKFMHIQNVTLAQLPQLLDSDSGDSRQGRSLRQMAASASPPGVWTVLLWAWRRCAALYVVAAHASCPALRM